MGVRDNGTAGKIGSAVGYALPVRSRDHEDSAEQSKDHFHPGKALSAMASPQTHGSAGCRSCEVAESLAAELNVPVREMLDIARAHWI
jgi:hypothetical protein